MLFPFFYASTLIFGALYLDNRKSIKNSWGKNTKILINFSSTIFYGKDKYKIFYKNV